ncbi:MAG: hypothetical protein HY051_00990 [Candidatus Aenigmarchaeota archaeon]|nr:hypothetical protein [Candidatus Aenigmarchaeota archaeon]
MFAGQLLLRKFLRLLEKSVFAGTLNFVKSLGHVHSQQRVFRYRSKLALFGRLVGLFNLSCTLTIPCHNIVVIQKLGSQKLF